MENKTNMEQIKLMEEQIKQVATGGRYYVEVVVDGNTVAIMDNKTRDEKILQRRREADYKLNNQVKKDFLMELADTLSTRLLNARTNTIIKKEDRTDIQVALVYNTFYGILYEMEEILNEGTTKDVIWDIINAYESNWGDWRTKLFGYYYETDLQV